MTKVEGKKARSLNGVVVSDAMDKTVVVAVEAYKEHPKYHKRYKATKKYKVHDENNEYKVGDKVTFVMCKPMSKDKSYRTV